MFNIATSKFLVIQLILFESSQAQLFDLHILFLVLQQNYIDSMLREKSKGKLNLNKSLTLIPEEFISSLHEEDLVVPNDQEQKPANKTEQNMHQFILSEFKIKYDQLKNQYQVKKKEADTLLYQKKKLQIELLNHNVEYYERQLIRLRSEVEKYQTENQENKHRFLMAENAKKDLEATSRVRQEELKQVLKQFEKEKITVVQLRHQLNEKDKNFTNILEGVQTNNHQLSQKYDQTHQKLSRLQSDFKVKNIEVQQSKRQLERKQKQLNAKSDQYQKEKEKNELQQYRLKNQLTDLQEDIKDYKAKENEEVKKLKEEVQQLKSQRASEQLLLLKKVQETKKFRDLNLKEAQIAKLQQNLREFQFIAQQRNEKIKVLQEKLKGVCSIDLLQQTQNNYNLLLTKHGALQKNMSARICELERQLQLSKMRSSSQFEGVIPNNFQQLLKAQIQENSKIKFELSSKIDLIFALKSTIQEQQIRESLYQNQIEILKKKQKAEQKNSKISFEIEIQNLKNEIESLRRKIEITETKLNIKMKEVKDKDAFITSVIIGRSRQEDVPFVIAELQRIFEAEYIVKLNEANTKIANLEKKLSNNL